MSFLTSVHMSKCYISSLPRPTPPPPPVGSFSFTSHLLYVIRGDANAPVFISHASFPRKPLRKGLLEIVCYISWVFGEYPVAVIEYRGQDIVSERQRSAFFDFEFHILFSPETQTRNQRGPVRKLNLLFVCKRKRNQGRLRSTFTLCVYGFAVFSESAHFFSAYFDKHQNPTTFFFSWLANLLLGRMKKKKR